MKRMITVINSLAVTAVSAVMTSANNLLLDGEEREKWVRLGKWGEYPGVVNLPGGKQVRGAQVLDREGAEMMKKQFYSVINQVAHLGKGYPIYEGHPDEPSWRKQNPMVKPVALGRFKEFEIRDDGPWVKTVFNDRGYKALSGDAPEFSAHSPRFQMAAIPGQPTRFRIAGVLSIGLTNDPNMTDTAISLNEQSTDAEAAEVQQQENNDMKLKHAKTMTRLGLNAEASEDATATAVNTTLDENEKLTNDLRTTEDKLTAANTQITSLQSEADKFRDKLVGITVNTAINEGKITEAQKPQWVAALKTDFDGESAKLDKLMGTVLNTADKVGDLGKRKEEGASTGDVATAINSAVAAYGKEHDLDVKTNSAHYSQAFAAVQVAKPELFA